MRSFFLSSMLLFLVNSVSLAQSIQISEVSNTANNGVNEFLVAGHKVNMNKAPDVFSISEITAISSTLNTNGVTVSAGNGKQLFTSKYEAASDDNSVKVYVKPNGGFILRENIANFLFYNSTGNIQQSISNSSQSPEGESVSELAADPAFKTVVLYNPKIVRNGVEGSRARVVKKNWTTRDVFYSSERAIRLAKVSENGQYIAVASFKSGTDDEVKITDRFGNELGSFSFNQNVVDIIISDDGEYVTIRSNSRVGVYSLLNGEREGSTSFRSTLHYAEFVPEDETIVAITADEAGSVLSNIEMHAINISERSIERQEYNEELGITKSLPLDLERNGRLSYTLTGLSKSLTLNIRF